MVRKYVFFQGVYLPISIPEDKAENFRDGSLGKFRVRRTVSLISVLEPCDLVFYLMSAGLGAERSLVDRWLFLCESVLLQIFLFQALFIFLLLLPHPYDVGPEF